jgi:hypothetical protein
MQAIARGSLAHGPGEQKKACRHGGKGDEARGEAREAGRLFHRGCPDDFQKAGDEAKDPGT